MRKQIDDLEDKVNSELKEKVTKEDSRLQTALSNLQTAVSSTKDKDSFSKIVQAAKTELVVVLKYALNEDKWSTSDFSERLKFAPKSCVSFKWFECSKARDFKIKKVGKTGRIILSFAFEPEKVLDKNGLESVVSYRALLKNKKECEDCENRHNKNSKVYSIRKGKSGNCFSFVPDFLEAGTVYNVKVRGVFYKCKSKWSERLSLKHQSFQSSVRGKSVLIMLTSIESILLMK